MQQASTPAAVTGGGEIPSLSIGETKSTIATALSVMDSQTPRINETMREFYRQVTRQNGAVGLAAAVKEASNHINDHGFKARMDNAVQAVNSTLQRVNALPDSDATPGHAGITRPMEQGHRRGAESLGIFSG